LAVRGEGVLAVERRGQHGHCVLFAAPATRVRVECGALLHCCAQPLVLTRQLGAALLGVRQVFDIQRLQKGVQRVDREFGLVHRHAQLAAELRVGGALLVHAGFQRD
jgi:hypothetical protein